MANQNIVITTKVEGLQAIERLNKEIDELKSVSDKASKELDQLKSKISKDLSKAADKAARQVDRLEAQVGRLKGQLKKTQATTAATSDRFDSLGSQFSKVGGMGSELGGVFDALSVTTAGPLGLAVAGLTIGLGAVYAASQVVSASFERVIERAQETGRALSDLESAVLSSNARMEESYTNLQESFDSFVVEFSGGARKIDSEAAVYNLVGDALDDIDTKGTKVTGTLEDFNGGLLYGTYSLDNLVQTALIATDNLDEVTSAFSSADSMVEGFGEAMDVVIGIHETGVASLENGGMGSLIDGLGQSATTAAGSFLDLASSIRDAVAEFDVGDIFDKVVDFVKDRKGKKPRPRRGGGKRKSAAERRRESGLAMVEGLAVPDEPFDPVEAAAARGIGVGDTAQIQLNELEDLARAAADLNRELQGIDIGNTAIATTLTTATAPALQMVAEGMIQLGSATVQTMGAFAAGVGTLGEFGDSVLDMFSDLSSQIGSFFIKTGIGMAFISPGTGAGLIAAGLSLQFLSGALGAKGSGNKGGGKTSGGGGTGSSSAVTREIQRSLRGPDRGGQTTNIEVVIAGRAIEPEMVSIVDDMVRLRRSRTLGRMGA